MKKIWLFIPLFLLLLNSCQEDDATVAEENTNSSVTDSEFAKNFGSEVHRDFIGQVVDPDNKPVVNATIKIGSAVAATDKNGVFILNDAAVFERFAYITATKSGYVSGSRSLVPTTGKNNINIMLLPLENTQTITSGTTTEVSLYSGTKVVFDGAFQDESGVAYTGNVNVSMFHLTPSDENISSLMPGMLYARAETGQQKMLKTFGMLHVELRGSTGQKLQLASGHPAEITMRIDDDQIAIAPQNIPLWHFDEVNGYWKQDGSATKQGNKYIGKVSHFSWWNCDIFFETVSLTVKVVDANGNPLSGVGIKLVTSSGFASNVDVTNDQGKLSGLVPANESLQMTIYNICGGALTTTAIGPFNENTLLPTLTLSDTVQTTSITGTFVTCEDHMVSEGYVILTYGTKRYLSALDAGAFHFQASLCSSLNIFQLEGYDFTNQQTTGQISYKATFPETKVGKLKACNTATDFMFYQRGDDPPVYYSSSNSPIGVTSSGTDFQILTNNNNHLFSLFGFSPTYAPGVYTTNDFQVESWETGYPSIYLLRETPNTMVFNVNKFGNVGEYIDISFSGTYDDDRIPLKGMIHVIRDR